jgi:DNA mismatch repair ATPase MutS
VGEKEDVYCLAVWQGKAERYGLAYADLSTRELSFTELESLEDLQLEIARVGAREILSAQEFLKFENQFVTRVSESILDEGYSRENHRENIFLDGINLLFTHVVGGRVTCLKWLRKP